MLDAIGETGANVSDFRRKGGCRGNLLHLKKQKFARGLIGNVLNKALRDAGKK